MYASVHADRTGRILVSDEREAAGLDGTHAVPIDEAIPADAAEVISLPRAAVAFDRAGRARPLGRDRLAVAALVPGHARLLMPAYVDDRAAPPLEPRAYAAVGADAAGRLVVAARAASAGTPPATGTLAALRGLPANAVARQLARCARENGCRAASTFGAGLLPVPLGAPAAERPALPIDLRSGYAGVVTEAAAFHPSADDIVEAALAHLARGGTGVAFGRACDGEPLARMGVLEESASRIRDRSPDAVVALETSGSDPVALRRALDAGVTSVSIRIVSALAGTYDALHGPVAHRWKDVHACLRLVAERAVALTVALLLLPGLSDRPDEIEAMLALLGALPGGRLELRDLGTDHVRVFSRLPGARPLGMRTLFDRLAEADHFRVAPAAAVAL